MSIVYNDPGSGTFQAKWGTGGAGGALASIDTNWDATLNNGTNSQLTIASAAAGGNLICTTGGSVNCVQWANRSAFAPMSQGQWAEITFANSIGSSSAALGPAVCLSGTLSSNMYGYIVRLRRTGGANKWQVFAYNGGAATAVGGETTYTPTATDVFALQYVSGTTNTLTVFQNYANLGSVTDGSTSSAAINSASTFSSGLWTFTGVSGSGDISNMRGGPGAYPGATSGSVTVTNAALAVTGQSQTGQIAVIWTEALLKLTGQTVALSSPIGQATLRIAGQAQTFSYTGFTLNMSPAALRLLGQSVTLAASNPVYVNWNDPAGIPLASISGFQVGYRPINLRQGIYPILPPLALPTDRKQLIPPLPPGNYAAAVMTFTYSEGPTPWSTPEVLFQILGQAAPTQFGVDPTGFATWAAAVPYGANTILGYQIGLRFIAPGAAGQAGISYPILCPIVPASAVSAQLPTGLPPGQYAAAIQTLTNNQPSAWSQPEVPFTVTDEPAPSTVTVS